MPAYGSQIIPQVQQVGDPRIPKADMTVANNVASQGAAGLAAFTQMAAMGQRAQLEREQLAQRGALATQELAQRRDQNALEYGLRREQMAQTYKMHSESLANQGELVKLRASIEEKDRKDHTAQLAGWLVGQQGITAPVGSLEFNVAQTALLGLYPRAAEDKWVQERLGKYSVQHQQASEIQQAVGSFINPQRSVTIGPNGMSTNITETPPNKIVDGPMMMPAQEPVAVAVGAIDNEGKFVGDVKGPVVRITTGQTDKDGNKVYNFLPKEEYLARGGHLAPDSMPAATATPTVTPTPAPGAYGGNGAYASPSPRPDERTPVKETGRTINGVYSEWDPEKKAWIRVR